VSNGFFKDACSTSAYLLEGPLGADGRVFGTNCVPRQRLDQDSYRGELGGILRALLVAQCIATVNNVQSGHLHLGLDGEEAMK
jgi:hypothetical protein